MTDAVYRERAQLVAFMAAVYPSVIMHPEPSWSLVYIETPEGQMSWHIAAADVDLFTHVRRVTTADYVWDGHSTDEKYERLRKLVRRLRRLDA